MFTILKCSLVRVASPSSIKTKYEMRDGKPVLMRLPEINFIDDKAGKPVGINSHIGRRPIAAFGNSDGDRQMLEWTQAGPGARLMVYDRPRSLPIGFAPAARQISMNSSKSSGSRFHVPSARTS